MFSNYSLKEQLPRPSLNWGVHVAILLLKEIGSRPQKAQWMKCFLGRWNPVGLEQKETMVTKPAEWIFNFKPFWVEIPQRPDMYLTINHLSVCEGQIQYDAVFRIFIKWWYQTSLWRASMKNANRKN